MFFVLCCFFDFDFVSAVRMSVVVVRRPCQKRLFLPPTLE